MFNGSITALITPFADGEVDTKALARLVRHQLDNGTSAVVPAGTTGETPTLSHAEYERIIEIVVSEVAGQIPVIAGAGSYSTSDAVNYSISAARAGADALLHVVGYYNRPGPEGIYQHFEVVSRATDLPVLVYNIPPRAVVDILPETMARLARLQNIVGVKDSTGDLTRPLRESLLIDKEFCFLTGEDQLALAYNASGGSGCISVTANIAPSLCARMQKACAEDRYHEALALHRKLMPLHRALFIEPSPAGVKYAASLLGLCEPACRLPIVEPSDHTKSEITSVMQKLEMLD